VNQANPYEAPKAQVATQPFNDASIDKIARGQRLVVYAFILYFVAMALQSTLGLITGLVALAALVMALIGVFCLSSGMGHASGLKILWIVLMFVPLINLITLLRLNSSATKALRAAGYRVGLLGASKRR